MQALYKTLGAVGLYNSYTPEEQSLDLLRAKYITHIHEWGYSYGTREELEFRFQQFMQADKEINEINAEEGNTFTVAHNQFSTWTDAEYKKLLSKKPTPESERPPYIDFEDEVHQGLEGVTVDWRNKGAVQKIQNQGYCGSCWAFSTVAAMESAHKIKTGSMLKLSEQQFVDCDPKSSGCDGGLEIYAWAYAKKKAIALGSAYPYKGKDGRCNDGSVSGKVNVMSTYTVRNTISAHKSGLNKQPINLGINASGRIFENYSSGILNDPKGSCKAYIDHAVTGVGYGTQNGVDYMIVRNSWGGSWGESGYFRISMPTDGNGICGIMAESGYATTN